MTQAGGRMAPERLQTWRERTAGWGVDLFVMYGQTEATARMAYLPPALAARHPGDRPADPRRPPRAAAGRRRRRRRRRARLPRPERHARLRHRRSRPGARRHARRAARRATSAATTPTTTCSRSSVAAPASSSRSVCASTSTSSRRAWRRPASTLSRRATTTGSWCACPARDAAAIGDVVAARDRPAGGGDRGRHRRRPASRQRQGRLRPLVDRNAAPCREARRRAASRRRPCTRTVLGRGDVTPASTFVSLGGDSLSYVECSVRLERRLGRLPPDWHLRTVAELDALERRRRAAAARHDGAAAGRRHHARRLDAHVPVVLPGRAHLMLAVAGYNTSRFHLSIDGTRDRVAAMARSVARLALPIVAFVRPACCWSAATGRRRWRS